MPRAVALWGAQIPCGGVIMPAAEFTEFPAAVQISMAAIDPTAEPQGDGPKRATLKIIRRPLASQYPGYGSDDDSEEDSEEEEESDDEETPKKGSKKASKGDDKMDVDSDKKQKKESQSGDDDEESDDEEDGLEIEEFVLCTLDSEKTYQQPLTITMTETEEVYFRVVGAYDVFLTGNYIVQDHDHDHDEGDSEDDEDYDLSPSEDEFEFGASDSEDELDNLANPRIQEVESEDDVPKEEKKLSKKDKKALKRSADEAAETSQKKQKGADGKPVAGDTPTKDKKVKFAKNLEQGPTPSPAQKKEDKKDDKKSKKEDAPKKAESKTRVVNGVTIAEATEGSGPAAKNGQKISVRYIGKLQKNGKQFDANVSGKPFTFTLGKGEVIKGWDIGMAGMRVGGARTLTIPPNLAYGNSNVPGIPKGSTLVFEVKCLNIK